MSDKFLAFLNGRKFEFKTVHRQHQILLILTLLYNSKISYDDKLNFYTYHQRQKDFLLSRFKSKTAKYGDDDAETQ